MRLQNRRLRVQISPALQVKSPTGDWDVGDSAIWNCAPKPSCLSNLKGSLMGKEFGGRPISASAHSSAQSGRLARTTPWGPLTPERALGAASQPSIAHRSSPLDGTPPTRSMPLGADS